MPSAIIVLALSTASSIVAGHSGDSDLLTNMAMFSTAHGTP